jgi:inhibitor of cysteine peptidase
MAAAALLGAGGSALASEPCREGCSGRVATFTDRDDGKRVSARVGDTLELRLSENVTTGYSWAIARLDAAVLAAAGSETDYPGTAIGGGGTAIFRFRAIAPGTGDIVMRYRRPWEPESAAIRHVRLSVAVER